MTASPSDRYEISHWAIKELCGWLPESMKETRLKDAAVKLSVLRICSERSAPDTPKVLAMTYWNCPSVSVQQIADAMNATSDEVMGAIPLGYFTDVCECGERNECAVANREALAQLLGGKICGSCIAGVRISKVWEQVLDRQMVLPLRSLPYPMYLQTEHWKGLRKEALKLANHACQICNATGQLDAHHRTYERLGAEKQSDITVLCRECHAKFHDKLPAYPIQELTHV